MLYHCLITLVLAWEVSPLCKNPEVVDNFDSKKYTDDFFVAAIEVRNPIDQLLLYTATCFSFNKSAVNPDTETNSYDLKFATGGLSPLTITNSFNVVTPKKGLIKFFFPIRQVYYMDHVICTDYTSYSINYACENTSAVYGTSEIIFVMVRNPKDFKKIINLEEVKNCLARITDKSARQMKLIGNKNCGSTSKYIT
uniref:Lipocalin/cytosolic fatty-acid binding domain-containing protein n=1 Tax=Clastoptera arizonana TaxID=38151 RepID=A0A1B6EAP7_9HEMI